MSNHTEMNKYIHRSILKLVVASLLLSIFHQLYKADNGPCSRKSLQDQVQMCINSMTKTEENDRKGIVFGFCAERKIKVFLCLILTQSSVF